MTKTAQEVLPAKYVLVPGGRNPQPFLKTRWSKLRQLTWKASLIMSEYPGTRLYIRKGWSMTNNVFNYGLFQISYNNGGMSAVDFTTAWNILSGIDMGLAMAQTVHSQEKHRL